MGTPMQPAQKSYFFDKGYKDLKNTIIDAWTSNFISVKKYKDNISATRGSGNTKFIFLTIVNVLAMIAVLLMGSIITCILTTINIVILLIFMLLVYIGFTISWIADRIYFVRKKIFTACHECKGKFLIPVYICPKCGVQHSNLTPSVYGILRRKCQCGQMLPTTFFSKTNFNGGMHKRRELDAVCPNCLSHGLTTALADRETVPICIPVVGGRSVGKTAFITAFSKDFIEKIAPAKGWETEFYNDVKANIYKEIVQDYNVGSTRMTDRPQDVNKASSISFSFFVKGKDFKPERLVHVYDIAGEVFTDNSENEVQQQYEYCQGIIMIIDPFSIPTVRYSLEPALTPEDIAGIGLADITGITNSFLNKLREVTGLSDSKMYGVPLAVVISKGDSALIINDIGLSAAKKLVASNPQKFNGNEYDAMDYLCRKFLIDNGMESLVNSIKVKFKNNRFFACSAIGHTRDQGAYKPEGVMEPMEWLIRNADSKMASLWTDTVFSKQPVALSEEK